MALGSLTALYFWVGALSLKVTVSMSCTGICASWSTSNLSMRSLASSLAKTKSRLVGVAKCVARQVVSLSTPLKELAMLPTSRKSPWSEASLREGSLSTVALKSPTIIFGPAGCSLASLIAQLMRASVRAAASSDLSPLVAPYMI